MAAQIDSAKLRAGMTSQWLGRRFHVFDSLPSTNTLLAGMADDGEPAGTMVLAEYQSAGKGRLNRRWLAPAGSSLLFSLLFRPNWPVERTQWLTMLAGLSVIEAIRQTTGVALRLKWPNDIEAGEAQQPRKCGGILVEGQILGSNLVSAVVGIGINVNIARSELAELADSATSILVESGRSTNRTELLVSLLALLEQRYEAADRGNSPVPEWRSALATIGQKVRVISASEGATIEGIAVDTDESGRLLVREQGGEIHSFSAGDVTILS